MLYWMRTDGYRKLKEEAQQREEGSCISWCKSSCSCVSWNFFELNEYCIIELLDFCISSITSSMLCKLYCLNIILKYKFEPEESHLLESFLPNTAGFFVITI